MQKISPQLFTRLVSAAALLTYFVIVLGAATRVFDAGMACPDWPLCYGLLVPFPEPAAGYWVEGIHYQWWQVALEWGHRLAAMLTGFVLLAITALAFTSRNRRWVMFTLPAIALLIIQIKLGGLTVFKSNIHWSVAAHLGTAMLFFAALITLRRVAAQTGRKVTKLAASCALKKLAWGTAVLVWLTMVVGAMVSSAHAGGVCGGLPDCLGSWWPADFGQQWHMKHRLLALLTTVVIVAFFVAARRQQIPALQKSAKGLKILLAGQLLLGVLTLYSFSHYAQFYQVLSVLHLAWGTLLFMAAVGVLGKIYLGAEGGFHRAS